MKWRHVLVAALAAGTTGITWATIETRLFALRRFELPILPAGVGPIRLLHISDIHLLPSQQAKQRWIATLAELAPDLVVNTGDNISAPNAIGPLTQSLGPLLHLPGVFVYGSNDFRSPKFKNPLGYLWGQRTGERADDLPTDDLTAALSQHGWIDLNNASTTLPVRDVTLELRGTGDAHIGRDDYAAVTGPSAADLTIGVTHAPYRRVLDAMTADGVELILAGHTHGGQVCVPGYGALVTNCDLPREHAKGLFRHDADDISALVHVSAGIGASPYAHYRFACRPEASLLTLTSSTW